MIAMATPTFEEYQAYQNYLKGQAAAAGTTQPAAPPPAPAAATTPHEDAPPSAPAKKAVVAETIANLNALHPKTKSFLKCKGCRDDFDKSMEEMGIDVTDRGDRIILDLPEE